MKVHVSSALGSRGIDNSAANRVENQEEDDPFQVNPQGAACNVLRYTPFSPTEHPTRKKKASPVAPREDGHVTVQTPLLLSKRFELLRNFRSNAVLAASRFNRLQKTKPSTKCPKESITARVYKALTRKLRAQKPTKGNANRAKKQKVNPSHIAQAKSRSEVHVVCMIQTTGEEANPLATRSQAPMFGKIYTRRKGKETGTSRSEDAVENPLIEDEN